MKKVVSLCLVIAMVAMMMPAFHAAPYDASAPFHIWDGANTITSFPTLSAAIISFDSASSGAWLIINTNDTLTTPLALLADSKRVLVNNGCTLTIESGGSIDFFPNIFTIGTGKVVTKPSGSIAGMIGGTDWYYLWIKNGEIVLQRNRSTISALDFASADASQAITLMSGVTPELLTPGLLDGARYIFNGDITLTDTQTFVNPFTLIVSAGATLTIPANVMLSSLGCAIEVYGTLINNGTVEGTGTLYVDNGTILNNGTLDIIVSGRGYLNTLLGSYGSNYQENDFVNLWSPSVPPENNDGWRGFPPSGSSGDTWVTPNNGAYVTIPDTEKANPGMGGK